MRSLRYRTALGLVIWLVGLHAVAAGTAWKGDKSTSSCCRAKRSCCCKSHSHDPGPAWKASQDCARVCVSPARATPHQAWAEAAEASGAPASGRERVSILASPAAGRSYLAYLHQRPPPVG
jgi:hypothetical protein